MQRHSYPLSSTASFHSTLPLSSSSAPFFCSLTFQDMMHPPFSPICHSFFYFVFITWNLSLRGNSDFLYVAEKEQYCANFLVLSPLLAHLYFTVEQDENHVSSKNTWTVKCRSSEPDTYDIRVNMQNLNLAVIVGWRNSGIFTCSLYINIRTWKVIL